METHLRELDKLGPEDATETMFCVKKIKEHRAKIKEYEMLLEKFEEEVEEPR